MGEVLEEKKQPKADWLMVFLIGITLISALAVNWLYGKPYTGFIKIYGLAVMLLFILLTGVSLSKWGNMLLGSNSLWIGAGYGIGLVLIMISIGLPIYNLWFIGAALIGLMVNEYLGISMQFILSYLYCGLNGYGLERMLFYFTLGAMICFFGKYLYKTSTMVYVTIIVLSFNIILLFVMNSFIFQDSLNENAVYSIASTFAVLLISYGVMAVKVKKTGDTITSEALDDKLAAKADETAKDSENNAAKPKEEPKTLSAKELRQMEIDLVEPKEAIYDEILEEDYELLKQLREKSPGLFAHSKKVAELSANGAVILGCSEKIAKAGGFYHEIGRLVSKDYIEAGVTLLTEHNFPAEVISILRQQNAKTEKPKSKEAAIVMLSESVVSTIAYFEKEKKKALETGAAYKEQPLNKVVENIFDIRFSKGSLDESGITIIEYKKLKNYYVGIYS